MAVSEQDAVAIHKLLMLMALEAPLLPVNPIKTMNWVIEIIRDGAALMAIDGDRLVATLGLKLARFQYSDTPFLGEQWLWCLPQHRDGDALKALFAEAKAIGEESGRLVLISILNASRVRGPRTKMTKIAELVGYAPLGSVIAFPEGN